MPLIEEGVLFLTLLQWNAQIWCLMVVTANGLSRMNYAHPEFICDPEPSHLPGGIFKINGCILFRKESLPCNRKIKNHCRGGCARFMRSDLLYMGHELPVDAFEANAITILHDENISFLSIMYRTLQNTTKQCFDEYLI